MNRINPALCGRRKDKDIMKLLMSDYSVSPSKDNPHDFWVIFPGPKDSIYEGGVWNIHVVLPEQYPYKSPSIGFGNKMFHPNIDENSGTVCLDVINQTWSPMFDLINIFDVFLPQLLLYPNPADPLNPEAANLMLKNQETYHKKVKDYVNKYASNSNSMISQTASRENIAKKNSAEMEEEELEEKLSCMSDVSELSVTSNISLLEEC